MSYNNLFGNIGAKFTNLLFRRVSDVAWDLTTGEVGIVTSDQSIATFDSTVDEETGEILGGVTINPFATLTMPIPAFGQKTPLDQVELGDIYVDAQGRPAGWIVEKKANGRVKFQKPDGVITSFTPPNVNVLGMSSSANGIMVVRSLMSTTGGNLEGFKNSLLPLMLMSGGNVGEAQLDKLVPLMLMQQSSNTGGNDMLSTMMMMQMMGKGFGG